MITFLSRHNGRKLQHVPKSEKKQKTVQLSWDPVVGKNKGLYEDMLSTLEVKNNAPLPTVHLKITSPVLKDPGTAET